MPQRLEQHFYRRDARVVARDLLGRLLVTTIDGVRTSGRIVETEAYLGVGDAASHSHRGPSGRNAPMFLEGGHAYVYLIYGMYWCFNVVTGGEGIGEAVLIRAVEPIEGIDVMRRRRGDRVRGESDLANGPGKLVIALGISSAMNGADLTNDTGVWIEAGVPVGDERVRVTPRIGITKATEHEWRFVEERPVRKRGVPQERR